MTPEGGLPLYLSLPPLLAVFLLLRLAPIWSQRHQGCDAYYFLLSAEELRRRRRLPIVLPKYYLLEPQEQWYPPLFSVFCAALPEAWLQRYYWVVNHAVDAAILVALFVLVASRYGLELAWAASLAYGLTGALVVEYRGLTSRALAAVLTTGYLFSAHAAASGSVPGFAAAVLLGTALLYTHKLSVQLLWFLVPMLALVDGNAAWLWPLAASYGAALALGRRYFVGILRAHADIVAFWARNWRLLGAHQVRQSPIYGDGATDQSYHPGTVLGATWRYVLLLGYRNPFLIVLAFPALDYATMAPLERFMFHWVFGTYLWALATLAIPWLRCLGQGTLYVKYAYLPTLALSAAVLSRSETTWPWIVAGLAAAGTIAVYGATVWRLKGLRQEASGVMSAPLGRMIERLCETKDARVMCLPLHLSDSVAYHARTPVLWGTHGYGFRQVEPIFPVLTRRIDDIACEHRLTHLLLDRRYASPAELKLTGTEVEAEADHLALLRLSPRPDAARLVA